MTSFLLRKIYVRLRLDWMLNILLRNCILWLNRISFACSIGYQFRSATAFATAAAGDLEAAEYHRAGDEQDDDGDHGAGQVPHAARPVQRVHPVGPEEGKDRFSNRGCQCQRWSPFDTLLQGSENSGSKVGRILCLVINRADKISLFVVARVGECCRQV